MKLSVVIPCYNEAKTIRAIIDRVRASPVADKEIIIVNDGSSDGTKESLAPYESVPGIRVHHSPVNLGKGASVRIGTSDATLEKDGSFKAHAAVPKDVATIEVRAFGPKLAPRVLTLKLARRPLLAMASMAQPLLE